MVKKLHAAAVKDKQPLYMETTMKSLIRKGKVSDKKIAQCCAKVSKIATGCHD